MTFVLHRDGEPDLSFRSHDAARRWAEANLAPGTWAIEATGGGGCCG